jgi:hypothetical protein
MTPTQTGSTSRELRISRSVISGLRAATGVATRIAHHNKKPNIFVTQPNIFCRARKKPLASRREQPPKPWLYRNGRLDRGSFLGLPGSSAVSLGRGAWYRPARRGGAELREG